jgi:chemotaxis protein methyltransferase CheR
MRWERFKRKVWEHAGVDLTQYRASQMDRRLASMAERVGVEGPEQFWHWLTAEDGRMQAFIDRLSINVSELLRNPEKWDELQRAVLPILLNDRSCLKAWSAGCSYGAEAYSLAMQLQESAPLGWHTILGTDIDQEALDRARDPEFSEADMRFVSEARREAFFEKRGEGYVPKPILKRRVEFRRHDLLQDPYGTDYDLILCRNVAIYLNDAAKQRLYRGFVEALRPGGVLFLGSTERISRCRDLGLETYMPFVYRKPKRGEDRWLRAS